MLGGGWDHNSQDMRAAFWPVGQGCRTAEVGPTGRRRWSAAVKVRIVAASFEPGARLVDVARLHGVAPQQVTTWRRDAHTRRLVLPVEDARPSDALVVEDPLTSMPTPSALHSIIEIEVDSVVGRLAAATPAVRVAEIAAALRGPDDRPGSSSAGGDRHLANRLLQGPRRSGVFAQRQTEARSAFRADHRLPFKARRANDILYSVFALRGSARWRGKDRCMPATPFLAPSKG